MPYRYNLSGAKYLWAVDETTELRLSAQFATIDFEDSFPNSTVYQPNFTESPIYDLKFRKDFSDRIGLELDAYYTEPILKNTEIDARVCSIARVRIYPTPRKPRPLRKELRGSPRPPSSNRSLRRSACRPAA